MLETTRGFVPGFGSMRLLAASAVFVSHAPWLTSGAYDPLYRLSHQQTFLGSLAVAAFFVMSGFLVTQSLQRNTNLVEFARKRALRILPALWSAVIVSACIIGPIYTKLPLSEYFHHREFLTYFLNALTWTRFPLPGVFVEHVQPIVNGSLWTLKYEVICYALLAVAFAMGWLRRPWVILALSLAVLLLTGLVTGHPREVLIYPLKTTIWPFGAVTVGPLLRLLAYFVVGVIAYQLRFHIPYDVRLACCAALGCVAGFLINLHDLLAPVCLGYLLFYFGMMPALDVTWLRDRDYSYGIYVYSFPIQQALIASVPFASTWWGNLLLAGPLVLAGAMLSWTYIERPALHARWPSTARGTGNSLSYSYRSPPHRNQELQ